MWEFPLAEVGIDSETFKNRREKYRWVFSCSFKAKEIILANESFYLGPENELKCLWLFHGHIPEVQNLL